MQKNNVLQSSVLCPGPLVKGVRQGGCGQPMAMKSTRDSKDVFMWRCRQIHTVHQSGMTYKIKDSQTQHKA